MYGQLVNAFNKLVLPTNNGIKIVYSAREKHFMLKIKKGYQLLFGANRELATLFGFLPFARYPSMFELNKLPTDYVSADVVAPLNTNIWAIANVFCLVSDCVQPQAYGLTFENMFCIDVLPSTKIGEATMLAYNYANPHYVGLQCNYLAIITCALITEQSCHYKLMTGDASIIIKLHFC